MSFGKVESRTNRKYFNSPQERITYRGEMKPFLQSALSSYDFGEYASHQVKQNGYEDFNLILETTTSTVFVKCFAHWRGKQDSRRYLQMIQGVKEIGSVRTPFLYKNNQGHTLSSIKMGGATVSLCLMQYLDGGNIWESNQPLSTAEQAEVIRQAAKINKTDLKPSYVKDSWAIINIDQTYGENRQRVNDIDRPLIESLLTELHSIDIDSLPHCFVHGDIRTTNVMRHSDKQVYVIDFSVANWYPRIMEMAVLCSDILFDPLHPEEFDDKYLWALKEYQKAGVLLTSLEIRILPLFVRLAHAMNVIGASSVNATNFISKKENDHWLKKGRQGLHFSVEDWKR